MDLNNLIAQTDKDMVDAQTKRDAENTKYEATAADLDAAVTGINGAIDSVKDSAPASFSQLKESLRKSLVIADVLEISPKHQRMMNALLQEEDDGVPESDFESHTGDLTALMQDLAQKYADKKAAVEEEETAKGDLASRTEDLGTCEQDIGTAEEALSDAQAMLSDDETYLKDLTAKCELKAAEWDQRSKMR